MANQVYAQVIRKNSYDYNCLHQESINCESAVSEGFYWRIPTSKGGVHTGFTFRKSDTKPTPDSVKTIRVNDRANGIIYYVAVADNATDQVFVDACNACCDNVEPLPTVAIPDIIIEETGCPVDGNYTYRAYTQEDPDGGVYRLSGVVNGVVLPTPPEEGFATLAALKVWADANWATGDLNGVTLDGGTVILDAGPTGLTGSITVTVGQFFESNAPGALAGGQNYHLEATVNGTVLAPLDGAADAALSTVATLANNTAAYAAYGTWSVVAGKIRLVSKNVYLASAALVVTKIP